MSIESSPAVEPWAIGQPAKVGKLTADVRFGSEGETARPDKLHELVERFPVTVTTPRTFAVTTCGLATPRAVDSKAIPVRIPGLGHTTASGTLASQKGKPSRPPADYADRRPDWLINRGLGQKSQNTGTQRKASPSTDTRPIDGKGRCVATRSSPVPASSLSSWMRTRAASSGSCSNPLCQFG